MMVRDIPEYGNIQRDNAENARPLNNTLQANRNTLHSNALLITKIPLIPRGPAPSQ